MGARLSTQAEVESLLRDEHGVMTTTRRTLDTRGVLARGVLATDVLALLVAAAYAVWTWQKLAGDPDADPLTALGYVAAILLAAPAVISLQLLGLARRARGRLADVLLGAAVVPPVLLGVLILLTSTT